MNTLFINEDQVRSLAPMADVIDALDQVFRQQAEGKAFNNPRSRLRMPGSTLHMLAASIPGYFGYKAYTSSAGGARFLFFLFQAGTTDLLSIMEADTLGQIRTGAATGLATRAMSNENASEAALFGAGWQAQSQLLAMDAVRNLKCVHVVNRKKDRREEFIRTMQPLVRAELRAAESAEDAVRSSQIVTTMTSSREPVLKGDWLAPGTHINAAGGNMLLRRELDDEAVLRPSHVVVDSIDQAKLEAGEFVAVIETGRRHWEDFIELRDVIGGTKHGRNSPVEITLFKSLGLALEDVATAKLVYERAIAQKVGTLHTF
jgi:ornithine cyclodeaminase/alanine dehydrogenase-like protein (mu-crystallin family)